MTVPSVGGYQAGEYMPTTVQVLNGEKTTNDPVRVDRVPGKEIPLFGWRLCSRTTNTDGRDAEIFSSSHARPRF